MAFTCVFPNQCLLQSNLYTFKLWVTGELSQRQAQTNIDAWSDGACI